MSQVARIDPRQRDRCHEQNPDEGVLGVDALAALSRLINTGEGLRFARQPVYSVARDDGGERAVYGHELLVRGPEGSGIVTPDKLFRLAILSNKEHHLDNVCYLNALRESNQVGGRVFVNLNPSNILRDGAVALVKEWADFAHQRGGQLVIEISEKHRIDQWGELRDRIEEMQGLSISFALDDFGSGFSNVRTLFELPIDFLKLDSVLLKSGLEKPRNRRFYEQIVSMAHTDDIKVIGEGVETAEMVQFAEASGCDFLQGYYFGRPLIPDGPDR